MLGVFQYFAKELWTLYIQIVRILLAQIFDAVN